MLAVDRRGLYRHLHHQLLEAVAEQLAPAAHVRPTDNFDIVDPQRLPSGLFLQL
ncbi:hypothetical protein D3C76_972450 [compost metagenome]